MAFVLKNIEILKLIKKEKKCLKNKYWNTTFQSFYFYQCYHLTTADGLIHEKYLFGLITPDFISRTISLKFHRYLR